MRYVKQFETSAQFNNFVLDSTNTPNVSLVEELISTTGGLTFTPYIQSIHDYSQDYFTIEAIDNFEIMFTYGVEAGGTMYYSINNGSAWNEMNSMVSLSAGDKISFKGSPGVCMGSMYTFNLTGNGENNGEIDGKFNIEGNIMSLIYGDNFVGQTSFPEGYDWVFYSMFYGQINLVNAGNLILPATTLADNCYSFMFSGCTSLTTAPELPAPVVVYNCYDYMFNGCTSLNYVKCLATTIQYYDDYNNEYSYATESWLSNVSASGIFVKSTGVNWPTGDNGIPTGWTVQDV